MGKWTLRVDDFSQSDWTDWSARFADYSIYQTWAYQETRSHRDGTGLSRVAVVDQAGDARLLALVRIRRIRGMGLKVGYVQWGPLMQASDREQGVCPEVLHLFADGLLRSKVNVLRVFPAVRDDAVGRETTDLLLQCGFRRSTCAQPYFTHLLGLDSSEEELRKGLHQSWRRQLNKSLKQEMKVCIETSVDTLDVLNQLYQDLMKRKGVRSLDTEVFTHTQKLLGPEERLVLTTAYMEGEPVSVLATSNLGDTGLMLLAASSEKGFDARASYRVWWEALLDSKTKGMKYYDLGGLDFEANPTVSLFKAGIGGEEMRSIGVFDKCANQAIRLAWKVMDRAYEYKRSRHTSKGSLS